LKNIEIIPQIAANNKKQGENKKVYTVKPVGHFLISASVNRSVSGDLSRSLNLVKPMK
jgi:hypothetical protein